MIQCWFIDITNESITCNTLHRFFKKNTYDILQAYETRGGEVEVEACTCNMLHIS